MGLIGDKDIWWIHDLTDAMIEKEISGQLSPQTLKKLDKNLFDIKKCLLEGKI
jgi:hypothetical protein